MVNEQRAWTVDTKGMKILLHADSTCSLLCIHTFVHFFSHLASSALVVRSWQAISRSILPHLHLTIVVWGQGEHDPLWQSIWHKCGLPGTKSVQHVKSITELQICSVAHKVTSEYEEDNMLSDFKCETSTLRPDLWTVYNNNVPTLAFIYATRQRKVELVCDSWGGRKGGRKRTGTWYMQKTRHTNNCSHATSSKQTN